MKPFLALLGLSFKMLLINTTNLGRTRKKRGRAATGVGALALIILLLLYLSGMYSFMMGSALAPYGALDIMLSTMILMGIVWPIFFILFGAQSLIFSNKDVDLVLSLPISAFSVMLTRILALYLEALLMCQLMLLPAGVAYIYFGGTNGGMVLLMLFVEGIFMALIPTLLSLLLGAVVALVVSRLPFKNLITILFSLLLMLGIIGLSFTFSYISNNSDMVQELLFLRQVYADFLPLNWALQGIFGNISYLLLFIALCTLPFFLCVWIFSRFYKGILTRLNSHRMRTDYKLRTLRSRGQFSALLGKEARRFFSTPAYFLNGGIMLIMVLLGCVVALFYKSRITDYIEMGALTIPQFYETFLQPLLLVCLCFMSAFSFVACVSISLEGKTLWILKEAPIDTGTIFASKAGFSFLLGGATCLIAYPILGYVLGISPAYTLLMMVLNLLFCLLVSTSGIMINLFLPRLDAENELLVIKQSASVMVSMLLEMVFVGLFVGLFFLIRAQGFTVFCLVSIALLVVLNLITIAMLNTKGRRLFLAL